MWKSCAQWPEGTVSFSGDVTEDEHPSREAAEGVCTLLRENGFGGDGKVFPLNTWVEPAK